MLYCYCVTQRNCTLILEHHVTLHDVDNKQIQTTAALKSNSHNLPSSHPVNLHKCDSAAKDYLYNCLCFMQICSYRHGVFTSV